MLIGQFWGTSDAMAIPAPYCNCDVCKEAREKGGKYVRTRSCFRLSDEVMVDLGADAVIQAMKYGPINDVQHFLFTHTHEDHLNPHMIMISSWDIKNCKLPLNYYLTEDAYKIVDCWKNNKWILKGKVSEFEREGLVKFHRLEYGKRYKIADFEVIPFKGRHCGNMGEASAMYLFFLPSGRTLFYGLDSGRYFPETIEMLKEYKIDIFISESTFGVDKKCADGMHMNMLDVRQLIGTLFEQGTVTDKTLLYLTHISHRGGFDEMEKAAIELKFPMPITIAYDGMKVL